MDDRLDCGSRDGGSRYRSSKKYSRVTKTFSFHFSVRAGSGIFRGSTSFSFFGVGAVKRRTVNLFPNFLAAFHSFSVNLIIVCSDLRPLTSNFSPSHSMSHPQRKFATFFGRRPFPLNHAIARFSAKSPHSLSGCHDILPIFR